MSLAGPGALKMKWGLAAAQSRGVWGARSSGERGLDIFRNFLLGRRKAGIREQGPPGIELTVGPHLGVT